MALILDLFAGPGGWSQACRALGVTEIGIELDADACATRAAAGHATIRADAASLPTAPMRGKISGLIASPPCQGFSMAGLRKGIGDMPLIFEAMDRLAASHGTNDMVFTDPRSLLVTEPLRYALDLRPEWIVLEQVPTVLPAWERIAEILRENGYQTWTGVLNAADYGVPQTRKRAILTANRTSSAYAPTATHAKSAQRESSLLPWVSMAQALGWRDEPIVNTRGARTTPGGNQFPSSRPSWALTEKTRSWVVHTNSGNGYAHDYTRPIDAPSPAVTSRFNRWTLRHGTQRRATVRGLNQPAATLFFGPHLNTVEWVSEPSADTSAASEKLRITEQQASVLQGFPADYPWRGTRTKRFLQIGNAVPPPLAEAVLSTVIQVPSTTP